MPNDIEINKDLVDKLASLSRIEFSENKESIVNDFKKIINYFDELKNLNIKNVEPMIGGTLEKNVFREDDSFDKNIDKDKALEAFPEKKDELLKVPPVFD
ncbi:MAG: Asp-tRNA(Asn)/Glu-tRNA(Gln) amidotransferase subunit GatC [Candidatus Paceibacterota bacterium]